MPKAAPPIPDDISKLSFEDALRKLEEIVQELESGGVDLEKSIDIYATGTLLKAHCEAKLKQAQMRIDKIMKKADGSLDTTPANIE